MPYSTSGLSTTAVDFNVLSQISLILVGCFIMGGDVNTEQLLICSFSMGKDGNTEELFF